MSTIERFSILHVLAVIEPPQTIDPKQPTRLAAVFDEPLAVYSYYSNLE
jgi:hypothetical protein